jgi:hypothetical protein
MGFGIVDAAIGGVEDFLGLSQGFKAAYAFEMIDAQENETIAAHVFVVNPRVYNLSEPFATTLTPAENDTVVAEENGIIVREITLEGTFGLKEREATEFFGVPGFVEPGEDNSLLPASLLGGSPKPDGTAHFLGLRKLFREYSKKKKDPTKAPFIQLVFHDLKHDDHFLVVPQSFETPRNSRSNRVHLEYRITMQAIDGPDFAAKRIKEDKNPIADAFATIGQGIQDLRSAFADLTALNSKIKRKVQNFDAIMLNLSSVITAVGNFVRSSQELFIVVPQATLANVAESFEGAAAELASFDEVDSELEEGQRHLIRAMDAINRIGTHPEKIGPAFTADVPAQYDGEKSLSETDFQNFEAGAGVGSRVRSRLGSGREAGLDLGTYKGIRIHDVQRSDSITSLSVQFRVPQELIITVNDLRSPYITQGGGPGVLKPGDQMIIPQAQGIASDDLAPQGSEDSYVSPEDALYGVDLALDLDALNVDGRLELREDLAHGAMDAELVNGLPNVVQGLHIALNQEVGTSSNVPDVGIRRTVGKKGTFQHLFLATVTTREAILQDDRVEDILRASIVLDGDTLTQEITPLIVGNKSVTVTSPFGKARGDS